jgi:rod shape determining protein RodA
MSEYRSSRDLDWPLVLLAIVISGFGILQIYSATQGTKWEDAWWKQLMFLAVGFVLMQVMARIDYHRLLEHVPALYLVSVGLLLGVMLIGRQAFGSRRWIPLPGGFTFQVSEFVKLVVVLLAARYLSEMKGDRPAFQDFLKLGALVALPMLLVMKQPDLGTSLTYAAVIGAGIFFAGLRWRHAAVVALLAVLALPVGWTFLKDYQKARLTSFMDPGSDPLNTGYQVIQSKIAVGSGGMWGKGVTRGSQTQLRFLPVAHTDFILSAFAEEHGFVGVAVVLSLYFLMLMQIVQNAQAAPDRAGMYVCTGVGALLLFHLLVNVGMLVGRMIVTGVPLPLMSYGGSSMITVFMMLGLVNNVRLQRFVN